MQQKKRALIVIDKLNIGGVSSSLLNLIQSMSSRLDINLIIFDKKHSTIQNLPENVHFVATSRLLSIMGMTQSETRRESFLLWILRGFLVLISKLINGSVARRILFSKIAKYGEYDYGISYIQDVSWKSLTTGCNEFVLNNVNARKKISFVHCDYANYGGYHPKGEKIYSRFDKIVCVSNGCKNSFIQCFPNLSSKTFVCENFTNVDRVNAMSEPSFTYDKSKTVFVTICRLAKEKGIDRMIRVLSRLKKDGFENFMWTVVGESDEISRYNKLLKKESLEGNVLFVGEQMNPYKYIKNANYLLLPSYHEAAPMVFGESVALRVPIITTNTISAKEMVEDERFGIVCDNSEEGLYDVLKSVVSGNSKTVTITIEQSMIVNKKAEKHFLELIQE